MADTLADLKELREQIDATDSKIVRLLAKRAQIAQEVGQRKGKTTTQFFAPERERQVFERLAAESKAQNSPLPEDAIRAIYREVISACRALEAHLQIAYLGPAGTFSHQAAFARFGTGAELLPVNTIPDVFSDVERGIVDYGIVPVENSTEGIVAYTLDLFAQTPLKICAEVYVPVVHNVGARSGNLSGIKRLYTHPQSLAQSRGWVRSNLPNAEIIEVTSNSKSAQMAAIDSEGAAICTDTAAELHGIPLVATSIQDSSQNRTRFLVLGNQEPKPSGKDKTSIFFYVPNQSGSLLEALGAFKEFGINLTMIESRPTKETPWEYVFFIDLQGHISEENVQNALKRLEEHSKGVKILGSYPEAR
jgi:chorismate mutase / prephenate dehydratase